MGFSAYADLDKKAKDLLKKGYVFNKQVKTKNVTSNGVTFETTHAIGDKDKLNSSVSAKFNPSKNISVDKIEFGTGGCLGVKFSYNDLILDGLKFTVDAKHGVASSGSDSASLSGEFKHDSFTFNGSLDPVKSEGTVGVLTGYEGFLLGGSISYNTKKSGELSSFDVGAGYDGGDFLATVKATKKLSAFDVNVHQKCSDRLTCAINANFSRGGSAGLAVGGKWTLDRSSSVQSKVDHKGLISLSYIQKVRDDVELTASSTVDSKSMSVNGIGFQLSFA